MRMRSYSRASAVCPYVKLTSAPATSITSSTSASTSSSASRVFSPHARVVVTDASPERASSFPAFETAGGDTTRSERNKQPLRLTCQKRLVLVVRRDVHRRQRHAEVQNRRVQVRGFVAEQRLRRAGAVRVKRVAHRAAFLDACRLLFLPHLSPRRQCSAVYLLVTRNEGSVREKTDDEEPSLSSAAASPIRPGFADDDASDDLFSIAAARAPRAAAGAGGGGGAVERAVQRARRQSL